MTDFDPTRFAVIADIHSNADALTAVLQDITAQGITNIVNLGDHLSGPMAARETADLLMATEMLSIRGNHDRWLIETARADMSAVDATAFDQLDDLHLNWLRDMPATLWVSDEVFACHGTPHSDTTYWMETVSPDGTIGMRPRGDIWAELTGIDASLLLCGHSHMPRRMDLPDGKVLLNPGSVGCPAYVDDEPVPHAVQTGTNAACYAVVEKANGGWATAFRHVPYDPSRMIALAKKADHAHWEPRLATGWVD